MRLTWSTDVHLNFLSAAAVDRFAAALSAGAPDAVVLTGDISEAPALRGHLEQLQRRVECPIYFVLGNHDFYRGSISDVRATAQALTQSTDGPFWLPDVGVLALSESTALVGVDGWGDARAGDYANTPIRLNDFLLIEDLAGLSHANVVARVGAIADADAALLRPRLQDACARNDRVIVATHVPPFRDACVHEGKVSDDDWLPWFCCVAVGDVLASVARAHPQCEITVLCGHTHSSDKATVLPNLTVHTGGADYGSPAVAETFDFD